MCIQTNILLGLPLNSIGFYFFVFGSTLVLYNFHYISKTAAIDGSPRLAWSKSRQRTHRILIGAGIIIILLTLFTFELRHYFVLLVLGCISFLYSFPFIPLGSRKRLKDFGVIKIITLSLIWTLVTVWFPVSTMLFGKTIFWFVFIKRFIFIFALCMVFDIRDLAIDKKESINTISVLLGREKAYGITYVMLVSFILIVVLENILFPGRFLIPFLISIGATTMVVAYSKKNNSDITCLFGVDGMMILQSLLIFVFSLNI